MSDTPPESLPTREGAVPKDTLHERTPYQPPIDKLLNLGNQQCNYITELGLGLQHVSGLMRMAVDNELLSADSSSTEFWAAIHAWRALGQLQVEDAIALLLRLFDLADNDAVAEEMPKVYGTIGEKAIPQLQVYLGERSHGLFARVTAINSLEEIAHYYVSTRNNVVAILMQQLKLLNQNPAELNGFIVTSLVNLQAKESASVIKYAFDVNLVADDIAGSWDDVREGLGISDDEELDKFQPEASQEIVEVVELSTPVIKIKVPVIETEIVEEAITLSTELHQENRVVEVVEEVTLDTTLQMQEVVEAGSENIEESSLSNIDVQVEDILEDVASQVNVIPIEASAKESIIAATATENDNAIESQEKPNSDEVTSIPTAKEQNKGFGGTSTKKEKSKISKKKKPNFTDL